MIALFEAAGLAAGKAIMQIRDTGAPARFKADCSPVTEADEAAEKLILAALAQHWPEIPVIAEEAMAHGIAPQHIGRLFFLVDPLDGTKEFVAGRQDFTVNIALIEDAEPVAGFVYAPALGLAYTGWRSASGSQAVKLIVDRDFTVATRAPMQCRPMRAPPVALASRSHRSPETDAFLLRCAAVETKSIGSSLKFCLIAEGEADIYPRFTRTMEWDTAAGDAILRAAGGRTLTLDGTPLRYGKTGQTKDVDFANPDFISEGASDGSIGVPGVSDVSDGPPAKACGLK